VARVLQQIEARWVAEGFPDAARIEQLLGEALAGLPKAG
jgi:poly(A) polymerase